METQLPDDFVFDDEELQEEDRGPEVARLTSSDGNHFSLYEGENLVGRDDAVHVLLSDGSVSKKHALLRIYDNNNENKKRTCQVTDLSSKLGTFLNGTKVKFSVSVVHGNVLRFGSKEYTFSWQNNDDIDGGTAFHNMPIVRSPPEEAPHNEEDAQTSAGYKKNNAPTQAFDMSLLDGDDDDDGDQNRDGRGGAGGGAPRMVAGGSSSSSSNGNHSTNRGLPSGGGYGDETQVCL